MAYRHRDISNMDNTVTLRDLEARREELEGERDAYAVLPCEQSEDGGSGCPTCAAGWATENPSDAKELAKLIAFIDEISGYMDRDETLINDAYFEDYARELAENCGMLPSNRSWPLNCIDWDAAADALKEDYTSAEWDGVTFWGRG